MCPLAKHQDIFISHLITHWHKQSWAGSDVTQHSLPAFGHPLAVSDWQWDMMTRRTIRRASLLSLWFCIVTLPWQPCKGSNASSGQRLGFDGCTWVTDSGGTIDLSSLGLTNGKPRWAAFSYCIQHHNIVQDHFISIKDSFLILGESETVSAVITISIIVISSSSNCTISSSNDSVAGIKYF